MNAISLGGIESFVVGNDFRKLNCFYVCNLFYSMNRHDLQRMEVIVVLIVFISSWSHIKKKILFATRPNLKVL